MEKNYIILISIIAIVALICGIGVIALSEPEMRNETIDGIIVSIPKEAELTKKSKGVYEDKKLEIELSVKNSSKGLSSYISKVDKKKDMGRIKLDDVRSDAICWKSDNGRTYILVVNDNSTKGIMISAEDEKLAIKMANSVMFILGEETYDGRPVYKVELGDGKYAYVDKITGKIYYPDTNDLPDPDDNDTDIFIHDPDPDDNNTTIYPPRNNTGNNTTIYPPRNSTDNDTEPPRGR